MSEAAAEATAPEAEGPNLSITDIQNALRVIDFAADQGAFKGWSTIEQVYAVRQKLNAFVTFAQANSAPAEGETAEEAPAEA